MLADSAETSRVALFDDRTLRSPLEIVAPDLTSVAMLASTMPTMTATPIAFCSAATEKVIAGSDAVSDPTDDKVTAPLAVKLAVDSSVTLAVADDLR